MRDRYVFMGQTPGILKDFNTLTLKQIYLKNENLFQKTGVLLLVENTKIGNAIFLYRTALPEANVKANRMGSTK